MTDKCIYKEIEKDGYQTRWKTECGYTVVCKVPDEVGIQFAPKPNSSNKKYCTYCGNKIKLK